MLNFGVNYEFCIRILHCYNGHYKFNCSRNLTKDDGIFKAKHPVLILIRGLPGSGKSFIASRLVEYVGANNSLLLDPDLISYRSKEYLEFTKILAEDGIEEKFFPYRYLRNMAQGAISDDKVVIWNQAFTNIGGFSRTVDYLQTYAKDKSKQLSILVIEVEIDPEIAKNRVASRVARGGHDVSGSSFNRFINDYKSFAEEGYSPITVNGADDISVSMASIVPVLEALVN